MEKVVIRNHHERWDGKGYPEGLKGEKIPFLARIVAVADAFDAMTSNRAYRNAKSIDESLSELEKCSGTQFDKEVTQAFINIFNEKLG